MVVASRKTLLLCIYVVCSLLTASIIRERDTYTRGWGGIIPLKTTCCDIYYLFSWAERDVINKKFARRIKFC